MTERSGRHFFRRDLRLQPSEPQLVSCASWPGSNYGRHKVNPPTQESNVAQGYPGPGEQKLA